MFGRKPPSEAAAPAGGSHNGTNALVVPGNTKVGTATAATAKTAKATGGTVDHDGFVMVGKGTKIVGQIGNCSVVEIEGALEGNVTAGIVIVRPGGSFKGEVQAEQAEVHGDVQGRVTVHGLLDVRATGRIEGEVTYETLSVAAGARLAGQLDTPAAIEAVGEHSNEDEQQEAHPLHAFNGNGYAHPRN